MYAAPASDMACKPGIESLFADVDQSILIGCQGGLRRLEQGRFVPFRSASLDGDRLQGSNQLNDRRGGLWIGTRYDGLYHIANGSADHFGVADGLSDDNVSDVFEDREGNTWVVTPNGVDRFISLACCRFRASKGSRGAGGSAVLRHGSHDLDHRGTRSRRDKRWQSHGDSPIEEGLPGQASHRPF
jgi:hypothetical protein